MATSTHNFPTTTIMLSKSRLRRLLPGRRRNRREDPIIQAIPISEEPPIFHDHDRGSVQEMPLMYSTQQHQPLVEPNLNIDYGRFQEAVPRPIGFGVPPSQHVPSVIAMPLSQHSQHYGERAITQLDYDGSQAPRSENYPRSLRHSLSRSRSRHRPSSRHSSKAPDIIIHPPSIANVGEHKRSGSPDPLPVPPPHYKGSYRDDRAYHGDSERHHSHRRRDYDRTHDRGHRGKQSSQVVGDLSRERASSRLMEPPGHPDFQFSRCTGRKRAVCIGINYTGQNSQLDGCVNDAKNIYHFLIDRLGFRARDIIRLTDEARDPRHLPTRANILDAMRWLVHGARKHDSLFFHYSGHGAQIRDRHGDEVDGYDEVIFPVDYSQTGTIIDDDLHDNLVKPLPPGCRLTAVIDSCHSGSVLDLPFTYHSDGRLKSNSVTKEFLREKSSPADVICWSGSADSGTAFGENEGGIAVGAMSYAFLRVLRNNPRPSYEELLRDLRRATRKYHQKPQLSASHRIGAERRFVI